MMADQHKAVPVSELDKHATPDNCWMVVNGNVYDLTTFAPSHPGGPDSMHLSSRILCHTNNFK